MTAKIVHPLCRGLRDLRRAAGYSLSDIEKHFGFPAVVFGAYERGDRTPPFRKLEMAYSFFGYEIRAVPLGPNALRVTGDLAIDLRAIADQLEERDALLTLP